MAATDGHPLLRLLHSFTLKLFLLALILLSVPLILYWQFMRAEQEQRALATRAVAQTNQVLAGMLQGHFEGFASEPAGEMQQALARAVGGRTRAKILVRLRNTDSFLYVAAVPAVSRDYLDAERAELMRSGILGALGPSCDAPANARNARFVNPAGAEEVVIAMTPVHVGGDCWIVITSENASRLMRGQGAGAAPDPLLVTAAVIYFIAAALVLWLFVHLYRNVRRFRRAARHLRMRDRAPVSFRKTNTIPELNGVAEDFDALVDALKASQARMKEAAEENSHALKTPLAVIAQSVEPIRRAIAPGQDTALRSLALIEEAVSRLDAMVSAQRDLDQADADMIYPLRQPMDLSRFLRAVLQRYEAALAIQGKRLASSIEDGVRVYANDDALEPIVENILENAASFTPRGKLVEVSLHAEGGLAHLTVRDRGPGVPAMLMSQVFERGVSFRNGDAQDGALLGLKTGHQGLGLWIVRRNVEALGGRVAVRNRATGGFEVVVCLPLGN